MTANPDSPNATPQAGTTLAARIRNFVIVLVAIVLSSSIFLGLQTETGSGALATMAETATPLEVALSNNKPTLMEFYANWCTSCQAMAEDLESLKQEYGDRINFVMLNVDNSKWLPEMLHYRVDGIPHFVFLDPAGEAIASTLGEQPKGIMAANLDALTLGEPLPHAKASGQVSKLESPIPAKNSPDDPRGHGSQVVN